MLVLLKAAGLNSAEVIKEKVYRRADAVDKCLAAVYQNRAR